MDVKLLVTVPGMKYVIKNLAVMCYLYLLNCKIESIMPTLLISELLNQMM